MNNAKKSIYIIIGLLLVLAVVFGAYSYFNNNNDNPDLSLQEILALDEQQRKEALEKQVNDLKNEAESLAESAESGTKFAILIRLAEAQIAIGKYDESIETLNKIPEDKKDTSRTPIAYARAYKGKGDIAMAKENINKALAIDNELPEIVLLNLELNQDLPNDQLDALYRDAIVKTKSNVDVMVSYARFSERIGNKDQAVAAWETAINGNPSKESEYRAEIARLRQ